jgi:hypothetical protein
MGIRPFKPSGEKVNVVNKLSGESGTVDRENLKVNPEFWEEVKSGAK